MYFISMLMERAHPSALHPRRLSITLSPASRTVLAIVRGRTGLRGCFAQEPELKQSGFCRWQSVDRP